MLSISHGVGGARGRIIAQELGKSGKKFKIIGICDWFWVKNGQKWGKRSKKGLFCFFPLMFERKEATAPAYAVIVRSLSAWVGHCVACVGWLLCYHPPLLIPLLWVLCLLGLGLLERVYSRL